MEHAKVTEVRALLRRCEGRWKDVQSISGLSYSWLSQFARGLIPNPTINSLQLVADACELVLQSRADLASKSAAETRPA